MSRFQGDREGLVGDDTGEGATFRESWAEEGVESAMGEEGEVEDDEAGGEVEIGEENGDME